MLGTEFRSKDVPAQDRFEYWKEVMGRTRPCDMGSVHADDFQAEGRLMELGPATVLTATFLPTRFQRSPVMVRRSDQEVYHLSLLVEGKMALEHAGRADSFGPGDLHLADSSRPFDLRSVDDPRCRTLTALGVDLPKALLPFPSHRVHELLGRGMSGKDGMGALLAEFLIGIQRHAPTLRPSDAPRLSTALVDLVSAWLAQLLDTPAVLEPETHRRVTVQSVKAFIRQHLHDPALTPSVIAAAHHISLSYLHRIFQQQAQGETVAAWIRARRLEGARGDLADPSLRGTPVYAIAARWGFLRADDFARAFRAAHGVSPRDFRHQSMAESA
ncbi:helix-turn-helix domain-containing protein [Streptomyces sp. NPDC004457]|uniref:helix-turn-helix domain-containing protein n=1 Tax=Streptomyces spinosus TaxID=2872623 RepID=UPI001CEC6BB7|nr:helix-turn-helix domain-containing protein [Streptomyces spinosus]